MDGRLWKREEKIMKVYKKSDLTLNHGLLVSKDGDIVIPDIAIVNQANRLETVLQEAVYLNEQPKAQPMPSLNGFERKSIKDSTRQKFEADTPIMDAKQKEALALMDEIDDVTTVNQANELLMQFDKLVDFVSQDFVIDCGNELYCFDTPIIGNVLDLTADDVSKAVAYICGMVEEDKATGPKHLYADELDDDEFDTLLGILANHDPEVAKLVNEDAEGSRSNKGTDEEHDTKADDEDIISSLSKLAHEVNDLCSDIEETSSMGNTEE